MPDFEEKVLQALDVLTEGQVQLQKDVNGLQKDVAGLRKDVNGLQKDMAGLQKDVRRLEVLHEETAEKIDQIIETVSPEMVKNNEQDIRLDDHEERIAKLELAS